MGLLRVKAELISPDVVELFNVKEFSGDAFQQALGYLKAINQMKHFDYDESTLKMLLKQMIVNKRIIKGNPSVEQLKSLDLDATTYIIMATNDFIGDEFIKIVNKKLNKTDDLYVGLSKLLAEQNKVRVDNPFDYINRPYEPYLKPSNPIICETVDKPTKVQNFISTEQILNKIGSNLNIKPTKGNA